MLEAKGLTKRYREIPAVDNVSFTLAKGEVTGYLGPNGSGKSTTVKMLTGLLPPDSGRVVFDGRDVREDLVAYKRRLGYVPEEAHVYPYLTGWEYLELVGRLRSLEETELQRKIADLLHLFSLHEHRYSFLSAYSKGMRQRVLIAAALIHNPELLIFDEPLSGLDVHSALLLRQLLLELARSGKTILYISHLLDAVEKTCSKVIVIYRGTIRAEESIENLRRAMSADSLESVFAQLVPDRDVNSVARDIVTAVSA